MKKLAIVLLIGCISLGMSATSVEAKSKSFTIRVSCTVPARLEMSTPEELTSTEGLSAYNLENAPPSKVQTQETKIVNGNRTLFYTVVAR